MHNKLLKLLIILGFLFLYTPIIILIIYSFNEANIINIWSGFSLKWYKELFYDIELINALIISLKVATSSASISVITGACAGVALTRFGLFNGRFLFSSMLSAPFVVPEVITGFSILMLFIFLAWPENRGILTITLAHSTIGMAYVALIVQARLSQLDRSLEEAALDLGCRPFKAFFVITIPLIFPALFCGWLLAFTLSIDDLVIASFTTGPGAVTLPMLIFSRIKYGISPEINALSTLIIITVSLFAGILTMLLFASASSKQKQAASSV